MENLKDKKVLLFEDISGIRISLDEFLTKQMILLTCTKTIRELKEEISKTKYDLIICDSLDGTASPRSNTITKRVDTGAHEGINQSTPIIILKEKPKNIEEIQTKEIIIKDETHKPLYDKENNVIYSPVVSNSCTNNTCQSQLREYKDKYYEKLHNKIARNKYNSIQAALEGFGKEILNIGMSN